MSDIQKRNVVLSLIGSRVMQSSMRYSPKFEPGHIQDADGLLKRLVDKSDGVSGFLNEQMDSNFKEVAAAYKPSKNSRKKLVILLVDLLNKNISGPSIYDPQRFQGINLKIDTVELLNKRPQGADLAMLNRRLLENAYYYEVVKGSLWQPNAELCHPSHSLQIDRYEILYETRFADVADKIIDQFGWIAPATEVRTHEVEDFKDSWCDAAGCARVTGMG